MTAWSTARTALSRSVRFFRISYLEAKAAHRSMRLGLLWLPISTLVFTAMLALVFRHAEHRSASDFFLYVLVGYVLWGFIADTINGSMDIIQAKFDSAVHNGISFVGVFFKCLVDRLFSYFLNILAMFLAMIVMGKFPLDFEFFTTFPIFIFIISWTSLSLSYIINLLVVLVPDLKAMLRVATRFLFFASPVFWTASETTNGVRAFLAQYNPVAYYLEISRQVVGVEPQQLKSWAFVLLFSSIISVISAIAFSFSHRTVRNLK